MNKTSCHSYFSICSNGKMESIGELEGIIRFVANKNSDFDPEYITDKLKINPYRTIKMGTIRKNTHCKYPFSKWSACEQTSPVLDVEEQCIKIVNTLKEKIPLLLEIKKEFDVTFSINIAPHIYNEEAPAIIFNKEIIEFCYITGTEIGVDLTIYDAEVDLYAYIDE